MVLTITTLLCLVTCISGLKLEVDPVEKIPMYDVIEMKVRLVVDPEDEVIQNSLEDVVITANLTDQHSWAVRILNESISFSYQDRR